MKFIEKYWAAVFLIIDILLLFNLTKPTVKPLSIAILGVGVIPLISNLGLVLNSKTFKNYRFILGFALIVILYQCTFGIFHSNERSMTYLLAKTVSSAAIVISIRKAPDFYLRTFVPKVAIFVAALVVAGIATSGVDLTERSAFGFGNPNDIGGMAALCFGFVFIYNTKFSKIQILVMLICVFGVVMSGSRVSLTTLVIALFMKYGFNKRTFGIGVVAIGVLFAISYSGVEIHALERITNTIATSTFDDARREVREASMMMIRENPIEGNGLYAQNTGAAAEISELGSHNGYIDLMKMLGIPYTVVLIFFLISDFLRLYKRYMPDYDMTKRAHFFIVFTIPLASYFEGYMWGVNQLTTTLFFISLSVLCYDYSNHQSFSKVK